MNRYRLACRCLFSLGWMLWAAWSATAAAQDVQFRLDLEQVRKAAPRNPGAQALTFEDALALAKFSEVRLSPSGRWVVYQVSSGELATNRYTTLTKIIDLNDRQGTDLLDPLAAGIGNLQWAHGRDLLYYSIGKSASPPQLMTYDPATRQRRAVRPLPEKTVSFAISADERSVGVIESTVPAADGAWGNEFNHVYSESPFVASWMRKRFEIPNFAPNDVAVYETESGQPKGRWPFVGRVIHLSWSPNNRRLLVQHASGPGSEGTANSSDISLIELGSSEIKPMVSWEPWDDAAAWLPDSRHFVFPSRGDVRGEHPFWRDINSSYLFMADADSGAIRKLGERDTGRRIGRDSILIKDAGSAVLDYRDRARRSYFLQYDLKSGQTKALLSAFSGQRSHYSISTDGKRIAYVAEDIDVAPEVWLSERGRGARQITHENPRFAGRRLYPGIDFEWANKYGQWSYGYYIAPRRDAQSRGPAPLVIAGYGFDRQFTTWAQYLMHVPVQWLADRGIGVLLWNYAPFPNWKYGDVPAAYLHELLQPASSIDAAADALVKAGVADPKRVGVFGHSMGGQWTGAAIVRSDRYRVASIHEAAQRSPFSYWASGADFQYLLRGLFGGPPLGNTLANYQNFCPELAAAPQIPVLLEGGSEWVPVVEQFGAWKHGATPIEMAIYGDEPHNMIQPRNQVDSAQLNLDWFSFWLLGQEDANPTKAAQYERWRKLKSVQRSTN